MADLTFWQQCVVSGVQGLGLGAAAFGGWLVLRHQERVKWDEQRAAEIRKLQLDAVLEVLRAVGLYHLAYVEYFTRQELTTRPLDPEQRIPLEAAKRRVDLAHNEAMRVVSEKLFLFGGALGDVLNAALTGLDRAQTRSDTRAVLLQLEADLARWLPPLKPVG